MLSLILKATDACNLRCEYCSVGEKNHSSTLSIEDMQRALEWFIRHAQKGNHKRVNIILHGGEPLLIDVEQYRSCFKKIGISYPDMDITYSMQTNGYYITDKIIDFIREFDIRVGISLDGNEKIHDLQRKDVQGKFTYKTIAENIKKLQENEIHVSVLMVVTKNCLSADLDMFQEFDSNNISVKVNPLYMVGEAKKHTEIALDEGDYGNYIIRLFDYIIDHEIEIRISPIEDIFEALLWDKRTRGCNFSANCIDSFICINQLGDIYPCGRFADRLEYKIGNITTGIYSDGENILKEIKKRRNEKIASKCKECKYLKWCNAGCSGFTFQMDENNKESELCKDYQMIFEYFLGDGLQKYKKYLIRRKNQLQEKLNQEE